MTRARTLAAILALAAVPFLIAPSYYPPNGGSGGQPVTVSTSSLVETLPNDTSTGTATNKLVVYTSAAQAKKAATSDTTTIIGICVSGCGTSGNSEIAIEGQASCVFDGATTAGHFVVASTGTAGDCHDAGATVPTSVQVLGYVLSTNGSGGTYAFDLSNVGTMAALNSKSRPGGSSGNVQCNSSGSFDACSDQNFAYKDVNQTWTKAQAVTPVALTPGAGTIAVDGSLSNGFTLTTGNDNNTLGNPSNLIAGQTLNFQITVGSGGHTGFATGTNYKYAGATAPTWSTAAAKIDVLSCWAVTTSVLECTAMIDVR